MTLKNIVELVVGLRFKGEWSEHGLRPAFFYDCILLKNGYTEWFLGKFGGSFRGGMG